MSLAYRVAWQIVVPAIPCYGVWISGGDEQRGKNNLMFKVDCHVRLIMQAFITVSGKKLNFER